MHQPSRAVGMPISATKSTQSGHGEFKIEGPNLRELLQNLIMLVPASQKDFACSKRRNL
jgi:hypothetical protein